MGPQISGQRLISSNHHSANSLRNLNNSLKRDHQAQEERAMEEEEAEEEAEEETEAAEAAEEETEVEVETEEDPEEEVDHQKPPSENDNFDIIITIIFSAKFFSKRRG